MGEVESPIIYNPRDDALDSMLRGAARATDREVELVLLRRTPCEGIVEYTEIRIVTRVAAGADLTLVSDGEELRTFNVRE